MRIEVELFAGLMEMKLKQNDHKRHWRECDDDYLAMRLKQEVEELVEAMAEGTHNQVAEEAADVANFAMMIADKALLMCEPTKRGPS